MDPIVDLEHSTAVVLIAGPHAVERRRWRKVLQRAYAVREVADQSALRQQMASLCPTVLALDLALCSSDQAADIPAIQKLSPTTRIILLSDNPNDQEGVWALKVGAKGHCRKDMPPLMLKKAVEMVLADQIWVGRNVVPRILEELTSLSVLRQQKAAAATDSRLERLTPREREVACLVGDGDSNKEIATKINVTEATVKAHLTAVFRKLEVSDRLRLALYMAEHGQELP
jgi:DNA-binding NarL/FixJ family response regulator